MPACLIPKCTGWGIFQKLLSFVCVSCQGDNITRLPIIKNNEDIIKRYLKYLELQSYKEQTVFNKVWGLVPFFKFVKWKQAFDVTQDDIENYVIARRKKYKINTIHKNVTELKFFYGWLKPENNMFCNIKTRMEKNRLPAEAILTQEEALETVRACKNQRDRAFIFVLWDSAARLDEILSLKVKDTVFDKYGAVVTVKGKTGMRRIRLVDSVPDLQLWLNQCQGGTDDYLFPNSKGKMSHRGAQNLITRAAERAGLQDRHVHAHLYRHSRLTDLTRQGLGEMELRIIAGWEPSSSSPATYIHLSGKNVDDKILAMHGIIQEDRKEEVKTTTKICPRCKIQNPFDSKYCRSCSMVLDATEAITLEEKAAAFDTTTMQAMLTDPVFLQILADTISKQSK